VRSVGNTFRWTADATAANAFEQAFEGQPLLAPGFANVAALIADVAAVAVDDDGELYAANVTIIRRANTLMRILRRRFDCIIFVSSNWIGL
jgi:hypothetical protein